MTTIKAKSTNYGERRPHSKVQFIVIHYTANDGDTAKGNGGYFRRNTVKASANFFIDQKGDIVKSVPLDHVAWAVGGKKWTDCKDTGGGKFYGMCTNSNSVSIELCDNLKKDPSEEQIKAVVRCIKYIRKYCKNANYIIRHFDVNGKHCPERMSTGKDGRAKWIKFKSRAFKEAGMDK